MASIPHLSEQETVASEGQIIKQSNGFRRRGNARLKSLLQAHFVKLRSRQEFHDFVQVLEFDGGLKAGRSDPVRDSG